MTLKQFCSNHGLEKPSAKRSKEKNYQGTNQKIIWLTLSDEVDGQDYLVMSATLAAAFEADKSILKTAQVQKTEEGWGIVMPATCEDLGEIEW